jgi:hypothetical protein
MGEYRGERMYFLVGVFINKGVEVVGGEIREDVFDVFSDTSGGF